VKETDPDYFSKSIFCLALAKKIGALVTYEYKKTIKSLVNLSEKLQKKKDENVIQRQRKTAKKSNFYNYF
jgi:hypothetical protein